MGDSAIIRVDRRGDVARVFLNRPERRNAFHRPMVLELRRIFDDLSHDERVRCAVLGGVGDVFCSGADLEWMAADGSIAPQQARDDAECLNAMYRAIDACPCPVIGRVEGPAYGGGVGLLVVCDVAVADQGATFGLSEARLGLVPAVIAPFVVRKAGESFMRRYALTGETFSASTARHFNIIHDVVQREALDKRMDELIDAVVRLSPEALRRTKALLRKILQSPETEHGPLCVEANAEARLSTQAREGLDAFLAKRTPEWAVRRVAG
ncbi:enoyl-CoA hydratase [Nitrospira sp.]|nr:enoyl-CoA hydratase [Nitrospira sp.]